MHDRKREINPETSVLDVISKCRKTEAIFRQYDKHAGECICCHALFESVRNVAQKYDLDMKKLMGELNAAMILSEQKSIKGDKKNG